MKIATRLWLTTGLTLAAAIAVSVLVIGANARIAHERTQIENAHAALDALFRLRSRTFEYLQRPEARVAVQWRMEYDEIGRRLQALAAVVPEDSATAGSARQDLALSGEIFDRLVSIGAETEKAGGREILSNQLQLKTQRLASGVLTLMEAMRARIAVAERHSTLAVATIMVMLVVVIAVGSLLLARSILSPLGALRRGIEIVGAGNLEYRIGVATHDELGELAVAFERMAEKLQQATHELRAASVYSRSLIEASLDPLVTISPQGKITDVNEATVLATGVSRADLIGSDFSNYFTEPEKARAGYQEVFAKGFVTDYPLALRHASGGVMEVLYNASVYRDERGGVAGVFAAARDVTQRRHAEEELRRYHEHLEELVRERTGELEAANKELEGFSYSVAHDLRTPLRAIDGYANLLMKHCPDKLDDEGQRYLNVVRDNTRKMSQLIDDMLAFSRMGRLGMAISDIDMEALARAVFDDLQPAVAGRDVAVQIKPMPPCRGDQSMLRQVWTNLLSNAIKFTRHKAAARIEVGGGAEGKENVYYVRDNGAGFDMQYVEKLFGVFQRLHGVEEFEGTGIGLAIVKRIVTRHGGRVWAEAKVNEGATIYFALPAQERRDG